MIVNETLTLQAFLEEDIAKHEVRFLTEAGSEILATAQSVSFDGKFNAIRLKLIGSATDFTGAPIRNLNELVVSGSARIVKRIHRLAQTVESISLYVSDGGECRILPPVTCEQE